jgi:hypothetical protein
MSVGFYLSLTQKRKYSQVNKKQKPLSISDNIRYTQFFPRSHYVCFRDGIVLNDSPDNVRDTLTEDHLFHFKHTDPYVDRFNADVKQYIGVFAIKKADKDIIYVYPVDADYRQIYHHRTDISMCWDIMDDDAGTPYWVDVHAHRMYNKFEKL